MSAATAKTPQQVWDEFRLAGVPIATWARHNGFTRDVVMSVLRGRANGKRFGKAREVAIALGLVQGELVDPRHFKPARSVTSRKAPTAAKEQ
jgi:gp16 family phage-associated protein